MLRRTLGSLGSSLADTIDRCVVFDDNSSHEDQEQLMSALRKLRTDSGRRLDFVFVPFSEESPAGHVRSLNAMLEFLEKSGEEFVFHCEDDWLFGDPAQCAKDAEGWVIQATGQPTAMLDWAMGILRDYEWIGQACLTVDEWRTTQAKPEERFWIPTEANMRPWVKDKPDALQSHWPSRFSLNPSVIRASSVKGLRFKPGLDFERKFGREWVDRGWTTVRHPVGFCSHLGSGRSAYPASVCR